MQLPLKHLNHGCIQTPKKVSFHKYQINTFLCSVYFKTSYVTDICYSQFLWNIIITFMIR